ncbi:MAG: acetylxylan esterase [Acidobacteria bacterium]|nr:acetylxylan esterase [Acidobacteriota bacterium]
MPYRRAFLLSALGATERAATLARLEQVMGPFPRHARGPVRVETLEEQQAPRWLRRKIRYESEPGCWVPAHLFLPRIARRCSPAMLCLHQTTRFGKDEPAGLGGLPTLHYARELAEEGFVTLAPDYCRFGEYKIDPYAMGYVSATMKGIWDHMRGVDLLESLPEVHKGSVGTIGHSLGGHNSLFVAAFDSRIKGVVTSCGFTQFAKYYGGNLKGWSHQGYMPRIASEYGAAAARMPFEFSDVLRLILPRRLFVYAPLEDSNFEPSGVVDAIRLAAAERRTVLRQPHGKHDFPDDARQDAYRYLRRWLG